MRTETIKLYQINELSQEARERALNQCRYWNTEHMEWWDGVYSGFQEILSILGFEQNQSGEPQIYFSGFCSQGDGASFRDYSWTYRKGMRKRIREYAPKDETLHAIADSLQNFAKRSIYQASFSVVPVYGGGNYVHENTVTTELSTYEWEPQNLVEWEEESTEIVRDLCRWLYSSLEQEHDYLTSDPAIVESLEANGVEFTEDGEEY